MGEHFTFGFDYISQLLTDYYQNKYKDKEVRCECHSVKTKRQCGGWDYDEWYDALELRGSIDAVTTTTAFGKKVSIKEHSELYSVEDTISEILDEQLNKEGNGLCVNYVGVCSDGVYVSVTNKNKTLQLHR